MIVCQVEYYDEELNLPCPERESGGYQCEVIGPHEHHAVGRHTKEHATAGNGYACSAFEEHKP